ncbi:MAG: hypothetical protein MZW92_27380 [Comamonadaceae bacterium]|nr:hypothetical protein [Comamonadaceae bacterium]
MFAAGIVAVLLALPLLGRPRCGRTCSSPRSTTPISPRPGTSWAATPASSRSGTPPSLPSGPTPPPSWPFIGGSRHGWACSSGPLLAALLSLGIGYLGFRFGLRGFYFVLLTRGLGGDLPPDRSAPAHPGRLHGPVHQLHARIRWQFQFQGKIPYYFVSLGFLAAASLVVWLIQRSKLGAYLLAIRDDEDASEALGVDTFRYKMLAYAVSAALTALGGTFYAYYQFYLQPNTVLSHEPLRGHHDPRHRRRSGHDPGAHPGLVPAWSCSGEFSRTFFAGRRGGAERRDLRACS